VTTSPIFLVVNKMYHPEIGGVETVAKALAEIIVKTNLGESFALVFNNKNSYSEDKINGVNVVRLPSIFRRKSIRFSPSYKREFLKLAISARKVVFNFPSGQPEVHFSLYKALPCEKICFYHADIGYGFIGYIYNQLFVRRFLDTMDRIVVTSPNIVKSSNVLKDHKEKTTVIPLFVNVSHFYPRNSNKREYLLSLLPKTIEKIVLYIGRLVPYKGLEYLIQAMTELNEKYGLLIIGEGPKREELTRIAEKLKLKKRVIFLNHVSYEELPEYYSSADVFVLPSISRAEAFGLVALEAMACGIPVITTELGTGTSYHNIHGKTGIVVPPKDSKSLSYAIEKICRENWKGTKSSIILSRAKEFSLNRFVEKIMEILT